MSNQINRTYFWGAACLVALMIMSLLAWQANAQTAVPTIVIDGVVRNETVSVSGSNFPANQSFAVRMGRYGTLGLNGALSDTTVDSGNGTFKTDIAIPAGIKDYSIIAIRLEGAGYNSYNWFHNNSTGAVAAPDEEEEKNEEGEAKEGDEEEDRGAGDSKKAEEAADKQVYKGVPALTFEKVEGENVTVRTGNFPPNQTFFVTMGSYQSAGNGPSVGVIQSGDGADASHTFTIPARIAHYGYILVRAQTAHAQPFYATAGFDNPSEPGSATADKDAEKDNSSEKLPDKEQTENVLWLGNPTLKACAVEGGKTVTVVSNNLPTNLEYTVRMNAFGTRGVNGEVVGTISPGDESSVRQTFDIPASLAGNSRIAIRVDAGIYHAFEFFHNATASVC